jgi:hypothetical protein
MRLLILFLLACASGLASSVDVSAICNTYSNPNGNWVGAVYSASCFDSTSSAGAEVSISGAWAQVSSSAFAPGEGDSNSGGYAYLSADYVLTVTGGTGGGFFAPTFSDAGYYETWTQLSGGAWIADSSNNGCGLGMLEVLSSDSCSPNMPFVFDTPETLSVSLTLNEGVMATDLYIHSSSINVGCCSFEFFANLNEPPLTGVSYTLVPAPGEMPTPEPGTFLLFAGAGCAGLVRRLLR